MTWAIVVQDAAEPDIARLSEDERAAVWDAFFQWTQAGPPRRRHRLLGRAELFVEDLPGGYRVTYFVHEAEQYAAIVRVRRI